PGSTVQMLFSRGPVRKRAGTFQHQVDVQLVPGQLPRIRLVKNPADVAVDDQTVIPGLYSSLKASMGSVVAGQISDRLKASQLVDRHDLKILAPIGLIERSEH